MTTTGSPGDHSLPGSPSLLSPAAMQHPSGFTSFQYHPHRHLHSSPSQCCPETSGGRSSLGPGCRLTPGGQRVSSGSFRAAPGFARPVDGRCHRGPSLQHLVERPHTRSAGVREPPTATAPPTTPAHCPIPSQNWARVKAGISGTFWLHLPPHQVLP